MDIHEISTLSSNDLSSSIISSASMSFSFKGISDWKSVLISCSVSLALCFALKTVDLQLAFCSILSANTSAGV